MIFSKLFQTKKKQFQQLAEHLYVLAVEQSRHPVFFEKYRVPDTLEGRLEVLMLHIFLLLEVIEDKHVRQRLIDTCFADMDQNLRQMGVGDMGVPKRIKKMAKDFNGRVTTYHDVLVLKDDDALKQSLERNLFGLVHDISDQELQEIMIYMKAQLTHLSELSFDMSSQDRISFASLKGF